MAEPVGFSPLSVARTPYPTAAPAAAGTDKTKKVSQDFEGVFLTNMFENMFEGLDDEGPFGGGAGNGVWRSMLTEQYAKTISAAGGIGIAKQIQHQLISLQEKSK
jgi:Rod binding domain-containing protein